jgi:hypothetical protein
MESSRRVNEERTEPCAAMHFHFSSRLPALAFAAAAVALSACQGNVGSSGLSIPQAGGAYGQPNGPVAGSAGTTSREHAVDGAVIMSADRREVPLPTVDGFSITLDLVTSAARPSGSASAAVTAVPVSLMRAAPRTSVAAAGSPASTVTGSAASAAPAPSATPAAGLTPRPVFPPVSSASGAPASTAPGTSGRAAPSASPSPLNSPAAGAKISTKTVVYPDGAPAAPTPAPSGDVQTFTKRTPIVRGYLMPETDLTIAGPAAVHFTIPKSEESPSPRGFTIAIFESGKKNKGRILGYDTNATLDNDTVTSTIAEPAVTFKKNQGYEVILYGDEQPATPPPGGYTTPGINPLPFPSGYATTPPGQQPYPPYQTSGPYTPQPYGVQPTLHP